MAYTYACVDSIEPVSDSFGEQVGNAATYNVLSGWTATYSASNMTKTIAAGVGTFNGSYLYGATDSVTLVSDPSNPRWTWTVVESDGGLAIVSGDPAATPSVPELGDNIGLDLDLIQAGQTVADNIVTKIDKRIPSLTPSLFVKTVTETVNNDTLQDDNKFTFTALTGTYEMEMRLMITSDTTADWKFAFTVPASTTVTESHMSDIQSTSAWSSSSSSGGAGSAQAVATPTGTALFVLHAIFTITTLGVVTLQWAQNTTTGGTDTSVLAGSTMRIQKVA